MAKILIIDDDPTLLDLVNNALLTKGHQVLVTRNPHQALPLLLREEPDLAIIDYQMPDRNGLELLGDIRCIPELDKIPFVMLTGNGDPNIVAKAISLGVTDFIVKPIKICDLLERLGKLTAFAKSEL